jgi:catechol 2,3-dioxygenase-like lactoylglutathione lyase family enzyme
VVPTIAGRREAFLGVALRTADVAKCEDYWATVLGLQKLGPFPGTETTDPSLTLGFAPEQAALQFIQVPFHQTTFIIDSFMVPRPTACFASDPSHGPFSLQLTRVLPCLCHHRWAMARQ